MNPDPNENEQAHPRHRQAFWLAGRFLLPFDPVRLSDAPAWRRAAVWLPVWGLLIGIAYAAAFRIAWLWLGEYRGVRVAPMVLLLVLDAGWFGYRLLEGAAHVVGSWRRTPTTTSLTPPAAGQASPAATVLIVLGLLVKFALLVSLPAGAVSWPADWREHLWIAYPYVIYRPLVLMPVWGRWTVLLASSIGRVSADGSPRLRELARGNSMVTVMTYWAAATALTVMYCSPSGRHVAWSMLISLGMLLIAYLVSFTLVRRFGGQTESTVTAAGWLVEFAFLLAYLPVARAIYWY
ncbi:MAG: adenosylcobinamide-GDP ribazoletransferase [Planctomycetes bacterium]|nr:adenosylcobinamide-GDP ribazoletransferase [Planctomycetota bacterium]